MTATAVGNEVPTSVSVSAPAWQTVAGTTMGDDLLDRSPHVFALTNVVLAQAEGFRHALFVKDWPPSQMGDGAQAVDVAGSHWSDWAEDRAGPTMSSPSTRRPNRE